MVWFGDLVEVEVLLLVRNEALHDCALKIDASVFESAQTGVNASLRKDQVLITNLTLSPLVSYDLSMTRCSLTLNRTPNHQAFHTVDPHLPPLLRLDVVLQLQAKLAALFELQQPRRHRSPSGFFFDHAFQEVYFDA